MIIKVFWFVGLDFNEMFYSHGGGNGNRGFLEKGDFNSVGFSLGLG